MIARALALVLALVASGCEVEVVLAPPVDGAADAGSGEDGGAWDAGFGSDADLGQDAGAAPDALSFD